MPKQSKSVVVLDDDEVDIFFARREIDKTELFDDIHQFTNPYEALKFFQDRQSIGQELSDTDENAGQNHAIDLLLLDFRMPYLNGVEFLEKLYADHLDHLFKKVAVMMTIPLMPDDEDRFRDADAGVMFLDKPLDADGLATIIRA